jgi:hypothetical protein
MLHLSQKNQNLIPFHQEMRAPIGFFEYFQKEIHHTNSNQRGLRLLLPQSHHIEDLDKDELGLNLWEDNTLSQ